MTLKKTFKKDLVFILGKKNRPAKCPGKRLAFLK